MGVERDPYGWVETGTATAATATATRAAPDNGQRHYVSSISGSFGATAAGKTLTLKEGTTTIGVWHVYDSAHIVFPRPFGAAPNAAVSVELESGGVGIVGRANINGYTV